MKQEMYDKMYCIESRHWWFCGKFAIVYSILSKKYHKEPFSLVDIGCGTGIVISKLSKQFPNAKIAGIEYSLDALEYCKKRFSGDLYKIDLEEEMKIPDQFDCALVLDVIEHIESQKRAIKNVFKLLNDNGIAIFTVPAYQFMWSAHDVNCMHKRRYNLAQLKKVIIQSGFCIEYCSYYNFGLFFPMLLMRTCSKWFHADTNSGVENTVPGFPANSVFKFLFSIEKHWIRRGWKFPFGGSIICIAQKQLTKLNGKGTK